MQIRFPRFMFLHFKIDSLHQSKLIEAISGIKFPNLVDINVFAAIGAVDFVDFLVHSLSVGCLVTRSD